MNQILQKCAYHYRYGGFRGLSHKAIDYALRTLWSQDQWVIYERSLRNGICAPRPNVVRRELGFRELVDLRYFKALDFPEAIRRRMDAGNVCHGFFEGNRLATIGWSSADYLELDADLQLPCNGSVGLYDFFTYGEFRSKGYYTNALVQLLAVMSAAGLVNAYIAVNPNNAPSIRGIERAGFRRALRIARRRRVGVQKIVAEEIATHEI